MLQQQTIAFQFCRPVVNRWLDVVFVAGVPHLPGYVGTNAITPAIEWRPQGWTWVDPLRRHHGGAPGVRSGFKSRSAVIAEQGYDRESWIRQIAEDNASPTTLGLVFDSDPRRTEKSGALQSAQDGIVSGTVKGSDGEELLLNLASRVLNTPLMITEAKLTPSCGAGTQDRAGGVFREIRSDRGFLRSPTVPCGSDDGIALIPIYRHPGL